MITGEPLKVCRQVKHCKKGFCEIIQMGLTERHVCIWNFWENLLFCCVSCLFEKVLHDFQKNFHANVLAVFMAYTWPRVLSMTIKSHLPYVVVKKQIGTKKAIWKKWFFRFYAKIAADTGFRSAALEKRKNTTKNKKSKLFKMLYWIFCQLFFSFSAIVRIFLDHWYNLFYSHYFCFKFGRML